MAPLFLALAVASGSAQQRSQRGIHWWDTQRRGANWFNSAPSVEWLAAARDAGLQVIRLAPTKWKSAGAEFLIDHTDRFRSIPQSDLDQLVRTLDQADSLGLKVVVTTLSLPGAVWTQHNGGRPDLRIWKDTAFHAQAAEFWKQLASALRGHPAVAGYNILNEPIPELTAGLRGADAAVLARWHSGIVGTAADLNMFNRRIITAIRAADPVTPVILDCGSWSGVNALSYVEPVADSSVIYAVHSYDPYEYTNLKSNGGHTGFPGPLPGGDKGERLDSAWLARWFAPVHDWRQRHNIPSSRMFIEEFGVNRRVGGADRYLAALTRIFNEAGWHWAFYSFREDLWDGMDYEMGTRPAGEQYWNDVEHGRIPKPRRGFNPLWNVLAKALTAPKPH